ncbi:hypothetical protein CPB85DRAFT_1300826 [Mucidula mucida]|nr:hypothetical protein CPB85DRAFT_1300826 [Mucidula mucida]
MVLISSKKYACETCIKGHRSSACKHTDRPLFEIKKKGRPVTQCEHCRELRKRKQVHVKCICMVKDDAPAVSSKKGLSKILECAAFPNGLPAALEASVALPDGSTSDSERSDICACVTGNIPNDELCPCATPRKSAPRKPKIEADLHPSTSLTAPESSNNHKQILARIAEFRPVLPKAVSGPVHIPSAGTSHSRSHPHDSYSPYGRAYDNVHPPYQSISDPSPFTQPQTSQSDGNTRYWPSDTFAVPSLCTCGDTCGCQGCGQHNPNLNRDGTFKCTNPSACGGCAECYVNTLPPADDNNTLDEWMQQQFGIQYDKSGSLSSCTRNCPPGLCQCESGCSDSAPPQSCCKPPTPPEYASDELLVPRDLDGAELFGLARSRSSSFSSGQVSPLYAATGSHPDFAMYAGSNPDLDTYTGSNPDVETYPDLDSYGAGHSDYAVSNPDSDGYAHSTPDMDIYSASNNGSLEAVNVFDSLGAYF